MTDQAFSDTRTLVRRQCEIHADRIAMEGPDSLRLSYRDLAATAEEIAARLAGHGIGRTSRVAILLPNGPEMALALLAVPMAGVMASLNPAFRAEELRRYLPTLGARAVLVPEGAGAAAREVAGELGLAIFQLSMDGSFHLSHAGGPDGPPADPTGPKADDLAAVFLTSGSTGLPKKVPLTHGNFCWGAHYIAGSMDLKPGERLLGVLEQFHISGPSSQLLVPLLAGLTVIRARSFSAAEFFRLLHERQPNICDVVPIQLHEIMAHARRHGSDPGRSMRLFRSGAAALPRPLIAEVESFFGATIIETYGMSEASPPITSQRQPPHRRKLGSVGSSVGPEVRVVAPDGSTLGPGETGEVIVRGPNITTHYEDDPAATAQTFRDGWMHTGDAGYLDADGDLFLTGRLKHMINRGGETVNPQEIDEVLITHPAIAQAACFAVPHRTLGETVAAAVVAKPGQALDQDEVRRFVGDRLSAFKVPQRIVLMQAIPLGPTGKYDRRALSAMAAMIGDPDGDEDGGIDSAGETAAG